MESSTREPVVDQHCPDIGFASGEPEPILLHYRGKVYELAMGTVSQNAGLLTASGIWEDITEEVEEAMNLFAAQDPYAPGHTPPPADSGSPWIPSPEDMHFSPWRCPPRKPIVMADEMLPKVNPSKPQPRYGWRG